jgi:signal-transduction protein with cAMP-binding, CBS, and nucleotidyltransferase domain
MARHRVHAIVVTAPGRGPVGLVTSGGLLAWAGLDVGLVPVGTAITDPAVSVPPGAAVAEVVAILRESTCDHVLVARTPQDRPEGIVSTLDVVALLA